MSSNTPHKPSAKPEPHHGSVTSYVTGFILSLIFTLIPYYLIVHETFSKDARLAIILGFAGLQMLIQVLFFLHLGREKKPHWNALFLMSTIGIIFVVVGGSIWIMKNLHYNMAGMEVTDKIIADEAVYKVDGKQAGTCPAGTGTNHKIMLMDETATPNHVDARLCDTLTFTNHDGTSYEIRYGTPEMPEKYAGQDGILVRAHHNKPMRLTEPGTYKFYDLKENNITGDFTVTQTD